MSGSNGIILPGHETREPTATEIAAGMLAIASAVGAVQESLARVERQNAVILEAIGQMDYVASEIAPYLRGEKSLMDQMPPALRAMLGQFGV